MVELEVYYDFTCPYCYLAKANWEQALQGHESEYRISWHSYQLNPDAPEEGRDYRSRMSQIAGGEANLLQAFKGMKARAETLGICMQPERITRLPNSLKAHCISNWLPDAQRKEWLDLVYVAYFCEGKDFGNEQVLEELLEKLGQRELLERLNNETNVAMVKATIMKNRQLGISSVPTMIINKQVRITGDVDGLELINIIRQQNGLINA